MVYDWKPGARVPAAVSADETHAALQAIKEHNGRLTAEAVAEDVEARRDTHPLNWAFTWDPEKAMHKLHIVEAGDLIRLIVVKDVTPTQTAPVRAFVVTRQDGIKSYENIEHVVRRPDLCAQLLQQVEAEFDAAEKKRRELLSLIQVAHDVQVAS